MTPKKRNYYLDFWKGIACFGVVFFHVKIPNEFLDGIIQAGLRFAIPLFFMISGYYCYYGDAQLTIEKMHGKIKHIFWINFWGCIYNLGFQMLVAIFGASHGGIEGILSHLRIMFNTKTLVVWFFLNQDPFVNIMWFTSALLYCYLIFAIVNHFRCFRIAYISIPVLLICYFFMGNVLGIFGVEIAKYYYRNFLFMGLPLFLLGHWFHRNEVNIMRRLTPKFSIGVLALGFIISVVEWFFEGRQDMFAGSLLTVLGIFGVAYYFPERHEKNFLKVVGDRYSLFVYVVHISVLTVLERFVGGHLSGRISNLYYYTRPVIIFCVCTIGAIIFYGVLDFLKRRNQ